MVEIELPIHSIMLIAVDHDQRRRLITAVVTGQLTNARSGLWDAWLGTNNAAP
jgi:hypothetical protein